MSDSAERKYTGGSHSAFNSPAAQSGRDHSSSWQHQLQHYDAPSTGVPRPNGYQQLAGPLSPTRAFGRLSISSPPQSATTPSHKGSALPGLGASLTPTTDPVSNNSAPGSPSPLPLQSRLNDSSVVAPPSVSTGSSGGGGGSGSKSTDLSRRNSASSVQLYEDPRETEAESLIKAGPIWLLPYAHPLPTGEVSLTSVTKWSLTDCFNTVPIRRCPVDLDGRRVQDPFGFLPQVMLRTVRTLQVGEQVTLLRHPHHINAALQLQCHCDQIACQYKIFCDCSVQNCPWPLEMHLDNFPPHIIQYPSKQLEDSETSH